MCAKNLISSFGGQQLAEDGSAFIHPNPIYPTSRNKWYSFLLHMSPASSINIFAYNSVHFLPFCCRLPDSERKGLPILYVLHRTWTASDLCFWGLIDLGKSIQHVHSLPKLRLLGTKILVVSVDAKLLFSTAKLIAWGNICHWNPHEKDVPITFHVTFNSMPGPR